MLRALITVALVTCIGLPAASAHPASTSLTPAPAAATLTNRTDGAEHVKVSAPRGQASVHSAAVAAPAEQSAESAWEPYGTLLAALVLMLVIALRRQKSAGR